VRGGNDGTKHLRSVAQKCGSSEVKSYSVRRWGYNASVEHDGSEMIRKAVVEVIQRNCIWAFCQVHRGDGARDDGEATHRCKVLAM